MTIVYFLVPHIRAIAWALERKIWMFCLLRNPNETVGLPRLEASNHCLNSRQNFAYYPGNDEMRQKSPIRLLYSGDHFTPFLRCSDGLITYELDLSIRDNLINPHQPIDEVISSEDSESDVSTNDDTDSDLSTTDDSDIELISDNEGN